MEEEEEEENCTLCCCCGSFVAAVAMERVRPSVDACLYCSAVPARMAATETALRRVLRDDDHPIRPGAAGLLLLLLWLSLPPVPVLLLL